MNTSEKPFIAANQFLPEITLRVIVLSVILTALLAMSNAYLALKIGLLTSAAIPAAVISMGVLRFFKDSNILENTQIQTAASAGEAVAGGIVYTVPALIIINYWHQFNYWENFFIALIGGVLGVVFSVPIRRSLVTEKNLPFPEGRAIAELLKTSVEKANSVRYMVGGLLVGGGVEFLQTGLKLVAYSWQVWFVLKATVKPIFVGFGVGFSATMIGAGYLIGFRVALSIMLGAVVGWYLGVPMIGVFKDPVMCMTIDQAVNALWNLHNRYIGIGAMLAAGIWTLILLLKPFFTSLRKTLRTTGQAALTPAELPRTERDLPGSYLIYALLLSAVVLGVFMYYFSPIPALALSSGWSVGLTLGAVGYVLLIGFVVSVITGYFSGMVGVSASPGSSVVIASVLFASVLLFFVLRGFAVDGMDYWHHAAAIALIICAVVTGAASIANDNIQDLKVGHLLGATPWKQQLMLLLGVLVASLVIPPIMQLLFNVYGIAGVMPRPDMDPTQSLPAPPAAMMAAVTQSVFQQYIPWDMMLLGALIIGVFIAVNYFVLRRYRAELSILGIAIGMYLPLASSTPLFIGGVIALLVKRHLARRHLSETVYQHNWRRTIVFACGLVAGAALMNVILAMPFALLGGPDALSIVGPGWQTYGLGLAILMVVGLGWWFFHLASLDNK